MTAETRPVPPRKSAALPLSALGVALTVGLTSCGANLPEPTEAAEQFADQLASEDLSELDSAALTDDSVEPQALAEATESLADYPVTVSVDSAVIDEDEGADEADSETASAEFTVTWHLDGTTESEESEDSEESGASASSDESATPEQDWTYTTEAALTWDEESETWVPQLTPQTLVPGLAEDGAVAVETVRADRGRILDTAEDPLAANREVQRIGIDKSHVLDQLSADGATPSEEEIDEQLEASATELAEVLDLDVATFVERVQSAGERAWVEFIVLRDDGSETIPTEAIAQIPGAAANPDTMVLGPTRSFARSVLGSYGTPTAEQVENSDGQLQAGEAAGLSGLQSTFDEKLGGSDGLSITVDNSAAKPSEIPSGEPVEFTREPTDGDSITTTLDTEVQQLAEDTIADSDVPAGLAVVRPSDGHILAAADGPESMSWPVALSGSYAPGSTFKIVTALSMLRNGMTSETTVDCPPTINIGGSEIDNYDGYPSAFLGQISLADAVAESCNTVFVGQWQDITAQQEHDAAVALGLVPEPIIGYDGAFLGSVPADSEGTQHAANLFGQGVVEASPLGMATVAASVAAGDTVTPRLVTTPEIDPSQNDQLPGNTPITEDEAATLRELMAGPVESGTVPILQDVPGADVLAKTGTGQFVAEGETLAHTWIMAIHGDLAVALFFNEGLAGAQTNGPVLQQFLTDLEEIIPSQ